MTFDKVGENPDLRVKVKKAPRRHRTTVTPALEEKWLGRYERGDPVTRIAHDAGATVKTVREHIKLGLERRRLREIRSDLYRMEMERHIDGMRDEALRVRELIDLRRPWREALTGWAWAPDPMTEFMPRRDIVARRGGPADSRLRWEALQSHFPRSPCWKLLDDWDATLKGYGEACQSLRQQLEEKRWPSSAINRLMIVVVVRLLENGKFSVAEDIPWEQFSRDGIGKDSLEAIMKGKEVRRVQQSWARLCQARDALRDALDEMAYKVAFPGECRFCSVGSVDGRARKGKGMKGR